MKYFYKPLEKLHCPVAFVHGEKDDFVPVKLHENLFNYYKYPVKKFFIIKNADHNNIILEKNI